MSSSPTIKLRPSGASRWLKCKASPGFLARKADELPEVTHDYTEEGTLAHDVAAKLLRGKTVDTSTLPSGMLEHVTGYVDFVQRTARGRDLLVEEALPIPYAPKRRGYVDAAAVSPDGSKLTIADYKHGQGVSVEAKENPQLIIYAVAFMLEYDAIYGFEDETVVTLVIYQPRVAGEETKRLWAVTYKELLEHYQAIHDTADEISADPDNQPFAPSEEACRFCEAAGLCTARAEYLLGALPEETSTSLTTVEATPVLPDPETLRPDQVARLLQVAPELTTWLDKVKEHAVARLETGDPVPGYKLVAARTKRRWADEEAALQWLSAKYKKQDVYEMKPISPAKAEQLLKERNARSNTWEQFNDLVTKPEGKATLAPETDKRPALQPVDPVEEFSDLL